MRIGLGYRDATGTEVEGNDGVVCVDLWYPRSPDSAKVIEVGLVDVRAADSLQVSYDFERDGWSIKQASTFTWDASDEKCDADWQEVAFVQAWAREIGRTSAAKTTE